MRKDERCIMMLKEFERLTGFYPSSDLYAMIERAYSDFDGSKEEFCAAYKANKDGLAEKIQQEAICHIAYESHALAAVNKKTQDELAAAKVEIIRLEKTLEKALGWERVGTNSNMSDEAYLELEKNGQPISEEKAKEIIHKEFGFSMDCIAIVNELTDYERSNAHQIRKVGTVTRLPHYEATDWNYIRFDVKGWHYEFVNGGLEFFFE